MAPGISLYGTTQHHVHVDYREIIRRREHSNRVPCAAEVRGEEWRFPAIVGVIESV